MSKLTAFLDRDEINLTHKSEEVNIDDDMVWIRGVDINGDSVEINWPHQRISLTDIHRDSDGRMFARVENMEWKDE